MKNVRRLLDEVLQEINPNEGYREDIFRKLNDIISTINRGQKNFRAVLGGSGAKGTWLSTFDADIFVLFNYKKFNGKSDKISGILEKALKKKFGRLIKLHGSRDYFQIRQNSFTFEIVPILNIRNAAQAKNITDVSPLHSKWVLKHKKLANEMRLTKQFCQAQNVYGAESYIRGFSGYVCEVLTAYYGSFTSLARNAAKWKPKEVIDVQKYYRGNDVFKVVNTSKLASPLIVIDPVQKDRNAAAALSFEKFDAFRKACSQFIRSPSKEFFRKKDMGAVFAGCKSKGTKLIAMHAAPLSGKADIVGNRLLKAFDFFSAQLEKHRFKTLKSGWEWDRKNDAVLYFIVDGKRLSQSEEISGPPAGMEAHAKKFRQAHRRVFVKNGRLFAAEKRKFTLPEQLLKNVLSSPYVRERSKSVKMSVL